jgi:putative FmdB family regulatory protein
MPTYEYACKSCGEHHDVVQSFGDDPLTECPSCGGPMRKVFGAVGVVFKGSGFYKTDSRTSSKKSDKKTAADNGSAGSSDSSGSSSDSSGSSDSAGKAKEPSGTSTKAAGTTSGSTAAAS